MMGEEMKQRKKLELLAPAGSYETLKAVIHAGADAVYLGGNMFGARAYANNFSEEELLNAIDYAHIHGRALYLTVNTLMKEQELEGQLYDFLLPYYRQGLDAVIVQDFGVLQFLHQEFPDLDIHTSTQMTVANRYGAEMMKSLGASRAVTAREMSFEEIRDIAEHVEIEIESFVHGALCYCYSGQCLLSSMLGGRSGNRGRCAQPCRLPYEVYDAARKKKIAAEPYILSPKDLCTIENIPQLAENGIFSFKIEGRMKQAEYAAGVVSVYRHYMDDYLENGTKGFQVSKRDLQRLNDLGNRSGFTDGYYTRHNGKEMITFQKPGHTKGNDILQQEIAKKYIDSEIKEKINGKLIFTKDFPAKIELYTQDACVIVEGDVVQAALKQPVSREKIEENMKKTGNTPFVFENLEIRMDEDIFLPVKSLNQLRRDAIQALEEKMLSGYRRNTEKGTAVASEVSRMMKSKTPGILNLAVSIENRELLSDLLSYDEISDVYLDASCYNRKNWKEALQNDVEKVKGSQKKVYYIFPTVFRKSTSDFYLENLVFLKQLSLDGIVVKSYDAFWFVKKELEGIPFILDQGLYSFNNRAVRAWCKEHPLRITTPFELNRKELKERWNGNSELVLYGYLPLMTSAQCIHANTGKCDRTPGIHYLKDRYQKFFPVKNFCMECYNTIYNSTPLILFEYQKELEMAGFSHFRLSFTIETGEQVNEIMQLYRNVFLQKKPLKDCLHAEHTSGHFKRGVE